MGFFCFLFLAFFGGVPVWSFLVLDVFKKKNYYRFLVFLLEDICCMEIFSFSFLMQFVFGGSVFNSLLLRVLSFFLKEKKEKFSLGSLRMVFFF